MTTKKSFGFSPTTNGKGSSAFVPTQSQASFMPQMDAAVLKAGNELVKQGLPLTLVQSLATTAPALLPLVIKGIEDGTIDPTNAEAGIETLVEEHERSKNKYGSLKFTVFGNTKALDGTAGKTLLVNIKDLKGARVRMNDTEQDADAVFAKLREKNPDMQASILVGESNLDSLAAGRDQYPGAVLESHLLLSGPVVFGIVHRQFPANVNPKDYFGQAVYVKDGQLTFSEEEGAEPASKKLFAGKPIFVCNTTGNHTPFPRDIEGVENKPFKVLRLQGAGDFQSFSVSLTTETRATLEELLEAASMAQADWTRGTARSRSKRQQERKAALEALEEEQEGDNTNSELASVGPTQPPSEGATAEEPINA